MDSPHVVNPLGAVHGVSEDMLESLLREGFRLATEAEVKEYYRAMGYVDDSKNVDVVDNSETPRDGGRRRPNKSDVQ